MIDHGFTTEENMVLNFLKTEIESPRFGSIIKDVLTQSGLDQALLIDRADLGNTIDNQTRMVLLKALRWYLFPGFPPNVQWRRADLEPTDLKRLKYAKFQSWITLSGGSRLVSDGAKNVDTITTDDKVEANVKAVVEQLRLGKRYPELIVVQGAGEDLILVEGHTRATAYVLAKPIEHIPSLVGTSSQMDQWKRY